MGRGIRQGYCISPILFNIYGAQLTEEVLEDVDEDDYVTVGVEKIKTIKYADDQNLE